MLFDIFKLFTVAALGALPAIPVHGWHTQGGSILNEQGQPFHIRGMSWFGFETQDFVVNGLWKHPMDFYLGVLKEIGVNVLRVPFSAEWILYHKDLYPCEGMVAGDPEHQHKTSWHILEQLFDKAAAQDLYIILDLHRLHKEYISELWYSPTDRQFTEEGFFNTWFTMLDHFGNRTNLFAVDLLNEPHGMATWGSGNPATDWRMFAESAVTKFQERYPHFKWLYFIEGINWGKDLSGVISNPLRVPESAKRRIVYSPHCYGKSVVSSVDVNNVWALHQDWDNSFGCVRDQGYAVVTGEWGGRTDLDTPWMEHYVEYLIEKNMTDAIFWSLGPNSGDVQGLLLDDWTTIDTFKAEIIKRLG